MITVAIDPGKHHAGWAIFVDGNCVKAGVARATPEPNKHGPAYRQDHKEVDSACALRVAAAIAAHVAACVGFVATRTGKPPDVEIITEFMHVYVDEDGKIANGSNPVSLINVQMTAGVIVGYIASQPNVGRVRVRYVEARPWKGQRGDQATWVWIRKHVNPDELPILIACDVYDDRRYKTFHHGLEAYGIGLWSLWRI